MLNDLNKLIGSAANTGGTTTVGTVMAKLNKLLTDWTNTRAGKIDTIHTNVSNLNTRLTSTRGGYLDKLANFGATGDTGGTSTGGTLTAKVNTALSNIGQTGNTGGSTSAGTMMAKLNKLLGDWTTTRAGYINTINTNTACLTSTRAGYIDKLSNFGATGDTGGSATAGTLMGKINKLLSDNASGGLKIKSVQNGKVATFNDKYYKNVDVKINTIVASKSILYINPITRNGGGSSYSYATWDSVTLTDTKIERHVRTDSSVYDGSKSYGATGFDYWIVEFE